MAVDFDVVERKPAVGPDLTLVRVEFRPVLNEPVHSNISHMQLWPTGRRVLVDGLGRLVTESGKVIVPIVGGDLDGLFPNERPDDPFRREDFARNNDAEMVANIEAYWERKLRAAAEGKPWPQHHNTTLNLQVGASADDADERDDDAGFSSTDTAILMNGHADAISRWNCGMRFTGVTIPQAATIDAATLVVETRFTSVDDPNLQIHMEDVDSAVDFATTADVNDRVITTAFTAWVATGIGVGTRTSPDFTTAVQELVDRGSWASGNAAVVLARGKSDATGLFNVKSYDDSSANAPKLDIDYTAAGGAIASQRLKSGTGR